MFDVEELRACVRTLDVGALSDAEARQWLDWFSAVERLAGAGKALVAARAATAGARAAGDRSAEHWLARTTGSTVGAARDVLDTAARLSALPEVDTAVRAGQLSVAQATIVSDAALADPSAQTELLATAARGSLGELRRCADAVKAAARSQEDDEARQLAIHRSRFLRKRVLPDGAHELHARGTATQIATFWSRLQPFIDTQFDAARQQQRHEPLDAHAFDALLAMSQSGGSARPPAKMLVRVDLPALRRGTTEPGEICEIAGYGPIPVAEAQRLMPDAFVALVVTTGNDVLNITHLGRKFTAHQQTALEWTDPECAAQGCAAYARLERDHRDDWARTKQTTIRSADRLCHYHHSLKTAGWHLEPGTGKRRLLPPQRAPDTQAAA